jgi:hypothetical protein
LSLIRVRQNELTDAERAEFEHLEKEFDGAIPMRSGHRTIAPSWRKRESRSAISGSATGKFLAKTSRRVLPPWPSSPKLSGSVFEDHLGRLLGDHDRRGVGVARGDGRYDRGVGCAQADLPKCFELSACSDGGAHP